MTSEKIKSIDGLRAVAVLAVVIYHLFPMGLRGGFIGVDVFFVISGYVITKSISNSNAKGMRALVDFYRSRILRVLPIQILAIWSVFVLGWYTLLPKDYELQGVSALYAWFFQINSYFSNSVDYFTSGFDFALLHLWSLSIEEQFYLVFPVLLGVSGNRKLLTTTTLLCLSLVSWVYSEQITYFSSVPRYVEILAGSLLFFAPKGCSVNIKLRKATNFIGLSAILISAFVIQKADYPSAYMLIPLIGTLLVIYAGDDTLLNRKIL